MGKRCGREEPFDAYLITFGLGVMPVLWEFQFRNSKSTLKGHVLFWVEFVQS